MIGQPKPLDEAIQMALNKRDILSESRIKYLLKSALAGIYIGFGIMISFRLGEYFHDGTSPATMMMVAIFFGIALVLIMYGKAELFTGNTMTFTMSSLKRATSWKDTLENWLYCYFGNLMGAFFFAIIILLTGLFSSPDKSQLLMEVASYKMNTSIIEVFFRAILCNWLVCLAVWIPMHVKGDGANIAVMMLLVFGFVISGYEHSVANMVLFSISLVVSHPESVTLLGAIHNLIPVTLGNIIGGSLFVGALYVYIDTLPNKKNTTVEPPLEQEVSTRIITRLK
ncbi:formate/nitrite transporter family protein [Cytobacillus sp. FJAT-54145]|uniref:Formate/nitrite transporter family protein n=1 Tax=Cytobacillus spartinae TaxID=3299023 RepID=A0ABW6K5N3_9BACI